MNNNPPRETVFNPLLYRPRNTRDALTNAAVRDLAMRDVVQTTFELRPWAQEEIVEIVELNMEGLSQRPRSRRLRDPDSPRISWTELGSDDTLRYESWMGPLLLDELQTREYLPEICTLLWVLSAQVRYDTTPRLSRLRTATETWAHAKGNCLELAALVGASLISLGHDVEFLVAHNPIGYATKTLPLTASFHAYAAFTVGQERFLADQCRLIATGDLAGVCASASRLTPRQYLAHMIGYGAGRAVQRGDPRAATVALERARTVDDRNYTFHTGLGEIAAITGDRREFLRQFAKAIALDPHNGEIEKRKGDLLHEAFDDVAGARRSYHHAIEKGIADVIVAYDLYRQSLALGPDTLVDDAVRTLRSIAADPSTRRYLANALIFERNDQPFEEDVSGRGHSSLRSVYGDLLDAAVPGMREDFGF